MPVYMPFLLQDLTVGWYRTCWTAVLMWQPSTVTPFMGSYVSTLTTLTTSQLSTPSGLCQHILSSLTLRCQVSLVCTVKSLISVAHLISCISWIGQSRNLRSQGKIDFTEFFFLMLCTLFMSSISMCFISTDLNYGLCNQ